MNTRDNMIAVLEGETPDVTPMSAYRMFFRDLDDPDTRRLLDMGLGITDTASYIDHTSPNVEDVTEEKTIDGRVHKTQRWVTPVGTVEQTWIDGWRHEYFIKSPDDYRVMQWFVENIESTGNAERYERRAAELGDRGVVMVGAGRTPAMRILVDWAGPEQFGMDVACEVGELFSLHDALMKLFVEEMKLVAAAPGRYVKLLENLTISMLGPKRYADLIMPAYERTVPMLEQAGKRVLVHYDGALRAIADQVAAAPFHMIESLTEPPEGDMMYDACRAAWPDKAFWCNLNVDLYALPHDELAEAVRAKRRRAGKRGVAFEISEDRPANWREAVPVVLRTLRELQ